MMGFFAELMSSVARSRWKKSLVRELSPAHCLCERERLANTIATRHSFSAQLKDVDPVSLRQDIAGMLDADTIKAGLAVRYVSRLFDWVYLADYEQSRPLEEEAEWTRSQLEPLFLPLVPNASRRSFWWPSGFQRARILDEWDSAVSRLVAERLAFSRDEAA